MKINHATLHTAKGTAFLRFPLNAADLREISRRSLFQYNPQLFETDPPTSFEKGELVIAGAEALAERFQPDQPFELDPALWHVLELYADAQRFPTFFQLRLEGKYPGNLRQALLDFSIKRTTLQENLPEASAALVRSILTDVVGKVEVGKEPDEQAGEELVSNILQHIQEKGISFDPVETLEKILTKREIPFTQEDAAFYFSVDATPLHWEVEMGITSDDLHVGIYSSTPIIIEESASETLRQLLDSMHENDPEITLEWDETEHLLFIYNQCTINIVELERDADLLLTRNLTATRQILQSLSTAFGEKLSLTK